MRMSRRMGIYTSGGGPLWLFDGTKGGDVTKITGGWSLAYPEGGKLYTSSAEVRENYLYFRHKRNDSKANSATLTTANLIDLSRVTTLNCSVSRSSNNIYGYMRMYIIDSSGKETAMVALSKNAAETVTSLDVSKLTGSYRVRFWISGNRNVAEVVENYVNQVWGE